MARAAYKNSMEVHGMSHFSLWRGCRSRIMGGACSYAFTLVELLIVIAIIAVLIAITMPSLTRAREAARNGMCRSNLKQAGMSLHTYTMDWDDWLAGVNTSGASLAAGNPAPAFSAGTTAVQTSDWISPTLGQSLGLPADREQRFIKICNTAFKCPSNRIKYDSEYASGAGKLISSISVQEVSTVSYSAAQAFHVYRRDNNPPGGPITDCDISYQATVPADYVPKFSFVGTPCSKIYVMDGARYLEETAVGSGVYKMSINAASYQKQGGNYMCYGPPTQFEPGDPFKLTDRRDPKLVEAAAPYAYRHTGRLNVVFFDGHSETLSVKESLNIGYYWPKGSKVNHARATYDVTAVDKQIIR
jgi:prepilin-type N-terminal cleavage/methylation domain-containing protein/prepilin-type processing-associated H-X9-DG protein